MSGTSGLRQRRALSHADWLTFGAAALLVLAIVALHPIGYVGGGADDEKYLAAARCWRELGGPCLPTSHWATRWPAFAPVAAGIAALGESRWTVGLGPLAFYVLALAALAANVTRRFGARAAALAVALLAATPAFTALALAPNTDVPELAFQLSALAAAGVAYDRRSPRWALLSGLLAGLALQARETSLLFVAVAGLAWLTLERRRRNVLLWALIGLAIAVVAEMAVYAAATGDPLLRWKLALHHTGIPSKALPEEFDTSQSPLFNPAYIAAWEREAGIRLWWPLDPWLNLLASPRIQALIWIAGAALLAFRGRLSTPTRATVWRILVCTGVFGLLLVYGLAVDPKSRMFLLPAAALSAVAAALIVAGWRSGSRLLALFLAAAPIAFGALTLERYFPSRAAETRAGEWIAARPGEIEIDDGARSSLALVPPARALAGRGSGRRYVILLSADGCGALIGKGRDGRPNGRVVDEVGGPAAGQGRLCLFEYLPRRG